MFDNILTNRYTQFAAVIAIPLAFFADYFGYSYGYFIAFLIVLFLFLVAYVDENKKDKLYKKANIPIPIVFNISNPADSKSALNSLFEILNKDYPNHQKNLKKYFNIIEHDLIYKYDGDIFNKKRFIDFLKITKHDVQKLEAQTPVSIHLHIIYIGPISSAVLIGAMLGSQGITLYQYNKSTNNYSVSLNINSREYKEYVNEFFIIKQTLIGRIKDSSTVTVAIDLASHKIALGKLKEPIVHLESTIGATIKEPKDFIRANQEIFTVVNSLQQKGIKIALVYSMPTTVAILLGMSMENYWDVEVTQFIDGEYRSVVKHLNEIKYYF